MDILPFSTPFNHKIQTEHQVNRTSLARRGQSLKPAELVHRLKEGGQIPELNCYENYNDSEFSDSDFDDCGTLFRIDPLEYVDQAREKMAFVKKYGMKNEDKSDSKDKKEKDTSSNIPDVQSKEGPDAASV